MFFAAAMRDRTLFAIVANGPDRDCVLCGQIGLRIAGVVPVALNMLMGNGKQAGSASVYTETLLLLIALLHGGNTNVQAVVVESLKRQSHSTASVLVTMTGQLSKATEWWRGNMHAREKMVAVAQFQNDWTVRMAVPESVRAEMRFLQLVCEMHTPEYQELLTTRPAGLKPDEPSKAVSVLFAVASQYTMLMKAIDNSIRAMSFTNDLPGVIDLELITEAIQAAQTLTGTAD